MKTDYSEVKFRNDGKLKLLIIVGIRTEIIRLVAVINKCCKYFDCILAHTGQNYDYNLKGVFFKDLKLKYQKGYLDAVGDDLGATMGNIINSSYKLMVQAVDAVVEMVKNGDNGLPVPNYTDETVSTKVVKLIQSYTGIVNKMVWRKE